MLQKQAMNSFPSYLCIHIYNTPLGAPYIRIRTQEDSRNLPGILFNMKSKKYLPEIGVRGICMLVHMVKKKRGPDLQA